MNVRPLESLSREELIELLQHERTGAQDDVPLKIFSHGPWIFKETGQEFTGSELDAEAFVKYRGQP